MTGRGLKTHFAFFFTALAALMMLAGSVLPHHHHGGCVCIDLSQEHSSAGLAVGVVCHQQGGSTHTDAETQCVLNVNYYCPQKENPMSVVLAHPVRPGCRSGHFSPGGDRIRGPFRCGNRSDASCFSRDVPFGLLRQGFRLASSPVFAGLKFL